MFAVVYLANLWAVTLAALGLSDILMSGVHIQGWVAYLLGGAIIAVATWLFQILGVVVLGDAAAYVSFFVVPVFQIVSMTVAVWLVPDFSLDGFWIWGGTFLLIYFAHGIVLDGARRASSPW